MELLQAIVAHPAKSGCCQTNVVLPSYANRESANKKHRCHLYNGSSKRNKVKGIPKHMALHIVSGGNSLFDTRKLHGSFYDTEKNCSLIDIGSIFYAIGHYC